MANTPQPISEDGVLKYQQLQEWAAANLTADQKSTLQQAFIENQALQKVGDGLQNFAGIVNLGYYSDEQNSDFSFPINFARTADKMSRDLILGSCLQNRLSLLAMSEWTFGYETKELENDPRHAFVLKKLNESMKLAGGMKRFIRRNVLPSLKYGISIFAPVLKPASEAFNGEVRDLAMFEDFIWYHPAFIFRIFQNSENLNKVGLVQYWASEKAAVEHEIINEPKNVSILSADLTKTEKDILNGKHETKKQVVRTLKNGSKLVLLDIDFEMTAGGVISFNTEGSNPIGRPFLYETYTLWKLLSAIMESTTKAAKAPGFHSYFATPLNTADPKVNRGTMGELQENVSKFMQPDEGAHTGGGVFFSNTHKFEKFTSTDLQYIPQMFDALFSAISRMKDSGVDSLGVGGSGANRSLSAALLLSQKPTLEMDAEQLCYSVSSTFLSYWTELNFYDWINAGLLREKPVLKWDIGAAEEVMPGVDKEENTDMSVVHASSKSPLQNKEIENVGVWGKIKNAALTAFGARVPKDIEDNPDKPISNKNNAGQSLTYFGEDGLPVKKTFIKRAPKKGVEVAVLDIAQIEQTYQTALDSSKAKLSAFFKAELPDLIEKSLKAPSPAKKMQELVDGLEPKIKRILEESQAMNAPLFAMLSQNEFEASLFTMGETLKKSVVDEAVKSFAGRKEFKTKLDLYTMVVKNQFGTDLSNYLTKNLSFSPEEIMKRTLTDLGTGKAFSYDKIMKEVVLNEGAELSKDVADALTKDGYKLAVVRTAIMDANTCEHCKELDGVVYYFDGVNWINAQGIPYYELPDGECAGMKYGSGTCGCKYMSVDPRIVTAANAMSY